ERVFVLPWRRPLFDHVELSVAERVEACACAWHICYATRLNASYSGTCMAMIPGSEAIDPGSVMLTNSLRRKIHKLPKRQGLSAAAEEEPNNARTCAARC